MFCQNKSVFLILFSKKNKVFDKFIEENAVHSLRRIFTDLFSKKVEGFKF